MKLSYIRAGLLGALACVAALLPGGAAAQTVVQLPLFAAPRAFVDLGNGPTEIKALLGNGMVATSSGSGIGSGSTTTITLTATPAIPPCIGCSISGGTLTASSHVTAYNGTTGITTDTSQTVAASTPLSWGAACPAVNAQSGMPVQPAGQGVVPMQAGVGADLPLFTEARICVYGANGPGFQFINFAIGAH